MKLTEVRIVESHENQFMDMSNGGNLTVHEGWCFSASR